MTQQITCPKCGTHIDLDQIANKKFLEAQEKMRAEFEKEKEKEREEMKQKALEFARKKADEAKKELELEMKDANERLEKLQKEREESKKRELDFLKKQRELEDKEKNFELEMEKKLMENEKKIKEKLEEDLKRENQKSLDEKLEKIQEEFRKKELEYQKQQEQLKKSLDDAKRKAEQGSQQIQGDIQENDLKEALEQKFPIDQIDDVPTGVKGADLIQTVHDNFGQKSGVIVWESKNTKSWQDSWIMKLKEDSLKISGNIAILVSSVLPKGVENFAVIDEVMVCSPKFAIQVGSLLRDKILSISRVEKSLEGKDAKMEMLYKYLTSSEFSSKMTMMIDVFASLKTGIDAERRAMEKNWKKREKDLERATFAVTGMYGELESLMGQALPGSEVLELESGDDEEEMKLF
ncbi:DUF2130 domain-containing protein [Candidatus Gracilibacteria bacterium]|nr:DUF2130 domain-containing protein [Candidatus Gracilibacteria bacterium]